SRVQVIPRWLLLAGFCLLIAGCGGGEETSTTSSDSDPAATPAPPTLDSAPPSTSTGASTPDGTVKAFLAALKNNQLGDIWDLLPPSFQQDINGLVRDFGGQVDAELWDKSFALMNRYMKVSIDKMDLALETPQSQQQFAMLGSMGLGDTSWLTKDKIKSFAQPSNAMLLSLIGGELSSASKLKAFDGKAFFSGSLSPFLKNLRTLIDMVLKEIQQNPQLQSDFKVQMFAAQMNLNQMLDQVSVTAGTVNGDNAIVNIQMNGQPGPPMNMTKVEGKWIPTGMATGFKQGIQMVKAMVPMAAQTVNGLKEQALPLLQELEQLIAALEQAKTQEEFNVAYGNMQQAMEQQMAGLAGGVPGFDPAMLGGGPGLGLGSGGSRSQSLSSVTVIVNQELNDVQLKKLIRELEQLTDNPEEAILLPKTLGGDTSIQATPVNSFQKFSNSLKDLNIGEIVEEDSSTKTVTLRLRSDFGQ
ncbi:MAG TPA: hypothetical protein VLA12_12310, partial [Planctomycetaceae bacterium]|nr:hypothetical protein [Planctomycetaceae bacterium]